MEISKRGKDDSGQASKQVSEEGRKDGRKEGRKEEWGIHLSRQRESIRNNERLRENERGRERERVEPLGISSQAISQFPIPISRPSCGPTFSENMSSLHSTYFEYFTLPGCQEPMWRSCLIREGPSESSCSYYLIIPSE